MRERNSCHSQFNNYLRTSNDDDQQQHLLGRGGRAVHSVLKERIRHGIVQITPYACVLLRQRTRQRSVHTFFQERHHHCLDVTIAEHNRGLWGRNGGQIVHANFPFSARGRVQNRQLVVHALVLFQGTVVRQSEHEGSVRVNTAALDFAADGVINPCAQHLVDTETH